MDKLCFQRNCRQFIYMDSLTQCHGIYWASIVSLQSEHWKLLVWPSNPEFRINNNLFSSLQFIFFFLKEKLILGAECDFQ